MKTKLARFARWVLMGAFALVWVLPHNSQAGSMAAEGQVAGSRLGEVWRSGRTLNIQTAQSRVRLVDQPNPGGDGHVAYHYLLFNAALNSHVVRVEYHEGQMHLLVHANSGHGALVVGLPLVSPDGARFLAFSSDLLARYDPNRLEIWRVSPATFYREASVEPTWGPRSARWVSATRVAVDKECLQVTESNEPLLRPCGRATLERTASGWQLQDR